MYKEGKDEQTNQNQTLISTNSIFQSKDMIRMSMPREYSDHRFCRQVKDSGQFHKLIE